VVVSRGQGCGREEEGTESKAASRENQNGCEQVIASLPGCLTRGDACLSFVIF
jgi:hypothetical protein